MQKNSITYDEVPGNFIHCFAECPAADTCLHALAGQLAEGDVVTCYVPQQLTRRGTGCPHYQSSEPVAYGRGLLKFLDTVPLGMLHSVVAGLQGIFRTERQYYRVRKGERLVSPEEQKRVDALAVRYGFPTPVEYDSTVMRRQWE